jgi:phage shock protein C
MSLKLERPQHGRYIFGVCAGLAQWIGWDVSIVRFLFLVAIFVLVGLPILIYFVLWFVMPGEPPANASTPENKLD